MIVVAARPSMGKTSFAMNIVENIAIDCEKPVPVAVFSLEMSAESLVQRLLCSRAEVEMQKLRGGFLSQARDFPRLMDAANKLGQSQIYIDDTPALTIMEMRAKARRLKKGPRHSTDRHRLPAVAAQSRPGKARTADRSKSRKSPPASSRWPRNWTFPSSFSLS